MADLDKSGDQLGIVMALQTFAAIEIFVGVILLFTVKAPASDQPGMGHAWAAGFALLAGSVFMALLMLGIAHLVQDTHDMKRKLLGAPADAENSSAPDQVGV